MGGVWEGEGHPLDEAVKSVRKVGVVSGPALEAGSFPSWFYMTKA